MLKEASLAPDFTLPDSDGKMVSRSDFLGKTIVLYFYPKDNTPGCSRQAASFRDLYERFVKKGVAVIGISKDSASSHKKFAEKLGLPFLLLSDPELTAIKAYDVWQEKKLYGKTSMGVVRTAYVISPDGRIAKVYAKADPDANAGEILNFLEDESCPIHLM